MCHLQKDFSRTIFKTAAEIKQNYPEKKFQQKKWIEKIEGDRKRKKEREVHIAFYVYFVCQGIFKAFRKRKKLNQTKQVIKTKKS